MSDVSEASLSLRETFKNIVLRCERLRLASPGSPQQAELGTLSTQGHTGPHHARTLISDAVTTPDPCASNFGHKQPAV